MSRCVFIMYDFELQRQSHVATDEASFLRRFYNTPHLVLEMKQECACDAVGVKLRQDLRNRSKIYIDF